MRAMLLFHSRAYSGTDPDATPDQAGFEKLVQSHLTYEREVLRPQATVVIGQALFPTISARTVRFTEGGPSTETGPSNDVEEAFGGFYLIECADLDAATRLAEQYPMPPGFGSVEVRPVMAFDPALRRQVIGEQEPVEVDAWSYQHAVETSAPPEVVWNVYVDVTSWPQWNAGIEKLELDGPFTTGAVGRLTPRGQEPLPFRLVSADPELGYVSETAIAETVTMRTTQVLRSRPGGGTRIEQRLSLHGPAAEIFGKSFGPAFAAGVPATMEQLAARAQSLSGTD